MQMLCGIVAIAICCAIAPDSASFAYQSPATRTGSRNAPPPDERVDINSASLDQLMHVPGMSRTWAARIIRFRPYRAKNDLVDRGVVTGQEYERIRDYIIAHRAKP